MNRANWLREKRREAEERYSTLWAPSYGETLGLYRNATHQAFMRKFLSLLPVPSTILDAACGAGRYMPLLLEHGHRVVGIDQSHGMLARAQALFPGVRFEKRGLQELSFAAAFDGVTCMDAMEHVCPEDWPLVLGNFERALKPRGSLYFTVEIAEAGEVEQAFRRGQQAGLPIVYGEWPDGEVYHYYPSAAQVRNWTRQAGFDISDEGEGDDYRHLIARKAG